MTISWHSKAVEDLSENIRYIAEKSPQNVFRVLKIITTLCDSLGHMSYKYSKEPVYNAERIRFVAQWNFKIIYRVEREEVYILRIFNTRQKPSNIFE